MTDDEYIEFLSYLFEEYIRERLPVAERYIEESGFGRRGPGYDHRRLQKAVLVARHIYSSCDDDDEILRTFTTRALQDHVGAVMNSCRENTRLLERLGILDCLQSHYREIVQGIKYEHLPDFDVKILAEMGSRYPETDLKGIIYSNKAKLQTDHEASDACGVDVIHRLKRVEEMIEAGWRGYYDHNEGRQEDPPKKSRRWFKGLGNIGQGVALSLGNIGLAIGAFAFPVSPETKTWGAIESSTTGVGMIMNGIGELRNE